MRVVYKLFSKIFKLIYEVISSFISPLELIMHSRLTKIPDHAITGLNFTMNSLFPFITSLHYDDMWLMSS